MAEDSHVPDDYLSTTSLTPRNASEQKLLFDSGAPETNQTDLCNEGSRGDESRSYAGTSGKDEETRNGEAAAAGGKEVPPSSREDSPGSGGEAELPREPDLPKCLPDIASYMFVVCMCFVVLGCLSGFLWVLEALFFARPV